MRSVVLYASAPEVRDMIERADELIASPNFRALKSEGKTLAGFLDIRGTDSVFIKRVDIPSWSRGIYARIRGSRAARSLAGAAMLSARGFAHPEPLAAMDSYRLGAILAPFILTPAIPRACTLRPFALGPPSLQCRDARPPNRSSHNVPKELPPLPRSNL